MEILPLSSWADVKKDKPLVIAGPCSAETEDQLLETCKAIRADGSADILRAGIWKPRTRPGSFEGVGEEGLKWFKNVKTELGMPITTEIANPAHVELALKYDVDVLWIGARSTVNPFTIQEIADSLRGVDIPVIVKNPINPDLALWMGAFERLHAVGLRKLAALHRGFSTFEKTIYRNRPMWQLAIELKSKMPNLPLLCDPSHIGGSRDLIFKLSQKALDLNYDGLMIETHRSPDDAWSDASQQVTPARLNEILAELKIKQVNSADPVFTEHLEDLRSKLDVIDQELIEHLGARMEVVRKLGDYKKENNVTVFQVDRWIEVFKSRSEWAEKMNVDKNFVGHIFKLIHDESIRIQSGR